MVTKRPENDPTKASKKVGPPRQSSSENEFLTHHLQFNIPVENFRLSHGIKSAGSTGHFDFVNFAPNIRVGADGNVLFIYEIATKAPLDFERTPPSPFTLPSPPKLHNPSMDTILARVAEIIGKESEDKNLPPINNEADWQEIKAAALKLIDAELLDKPSNHLDYIRGRLAELSSNVG